MRIGRKPEQTENMQSKAVIKKNKKQKGEAIGDRNHKHTDRWETELGGC